MKALKVQGYSREDLPYKAPFQSWGSYFALVIIAIITFFKGYDTFIPFKVDTFITTYIALPTFFVLWSGYKFYYKTKVIPLDQIDLISGKREIDEEEEQFLAEQAKLGPRTRLQRISYLFPPTFSFYSRLEFVFHFVLTRPLACTMSLRAQLCIVTAHVSFPLKYC